MEFSDVFLSYRRTDVDFVKRVDQALKASGREVWVDWEDIPPGVEGFTDEILRGIQATNAFIAVLSPSYLESPYCLLELEEALRLKKKVIPIVYQKFDPAPPPSGIGHINWVYFTPHAGQENPFDEAFAKVIDALEADFTHVREHTRLLVRATDWDKNERSRGFLLSGSEVERAESWLLSGATKNPPPPDLVGEYVVVSRKQQRQQQQRITAVIGVLFVMAVIAAILALLQATEARRQESIARDAEANAQRSAEVAQSRALSAAALQPGNETLAVGLALEAMRSPFAPPEAFQTLAAVAYPPGGIRHLISAVRDDNTYLGTQMLHPAISSDGRLVVVENRLYDMTTGNLLIEFEAVPQYIRAGLFTPDASHVILAGDDAGYLDPSANPVFLGLYDVATGALVRQFDTGIGVADIQLSADGETLISYLPNGTAVWWDVASGGRLRQIGYRGTPMTFSPNLDWNALLQADPATGDIQLAMTEAGTLDDEPLTYEPLNYGEMAFSSDSSEVAVAYNTTQLGIYEAATGQMLQSFDMGMGNSATSVRFSPNGISLLTTHRDGSIMVWDRGTGTAQRLIGHRVEVLLAEFVNNGEQIVSIDAAGTVIQWDLLPGNLRQRGCFNDADLIAPDGRFVVAVDCSSDLVILDAATLEEVNRLAPPSDGWRINPNLTADGRHVLVEESSAAGSALVALDSTTLEEAARVTLTDITGYSVYLAADLEHSQYAYSAFIQPADQSTPSSSKVSLAMLTTGEVLQEWVIDGYVQGLWMSPDGLRLLVQYMNPTDGSVHNQLLDSTTGEIIVQDFSAKFSPNPVFSPDGSLLWFAVESDAQNLPVGWADSIGVMDAASGERLLALADLPTEAVWFTPDSSQFITAVPTTNGTRLRFHDAHSGAILREITLSERFRGLAFHPDGQSFFTYSMQGGGVGISFLPSGIPVLSFSSLNENSVTTQWDIHSGERLREFGGAGYSFLYFVYPDGTQLFQDSGVWQLDTPEQLIEWVCANRYVPAFTAEERARYGIASESNLCAVTSGE